MSKIKWENTIRPNSNGVANDMNHFNKLNSLANGRLRVVSKETELSKESKDAVKKATTKKGKGGSQSDSPQSDS